MIDCPGLCKWAKGLQFKAHALFGRDRRWTTNLKTAVLKSEIMDGVQTETRKSSESSPLLSKTASSEYDNVSLKSRPETFDDALESTGVGLFHCILVLVAGWALASDSVEVQCISFVTPLLDNVDRNPDTKLAPSKVKKRVIMYTIFDTLNHVCHVERPFPFSFFVPAGWPRSSPFHMNVTTKYK